MRPVIDCLLSSRCSRPAVRCVPSPAINGCHMHCIQVLYHYQHNSYYHSKTLYFLCRRIKTTAPCCMCPIYSTGHTLEQVHSIELVNMQKWVITVQNMAVYQWWIQDFGRGRCICPTACSPAHLNDLVSGHLFTEPEIELVEELLFTADWELAIGI